MIINNYNSSYPPHTNGTKDVKPLYIEKGQRMASPQTMVASTMQTMNGRVIRRYTG